MFTRLPLRLAPLCCGLFILMAEDDSCTINLGGDRPGGHDDTCVDRADVCPTLACEVFASDAEGCEICECEEAPPTGCTSDSACGPGEVCVQTDVCPPCGEEEPACMMPCTVTGECMPAPTPTGCSDDSSCAPGEVCVQTEICPACGNEDPACLMPCTFSGECVPAPLTCANVRCEPGSVCTETREGPVCGPTGYCQTDAECAPDSICNTWDYCINPDCNTNDGCEPVCTHGICEVGDYGGCLTDPECGAGYHCELTCGGPVDLVACPSTGQCVADVPTCYSDDGCAESQHCSVSDGDCRSDPTCPSCDVCAGVCVDDAPAGCSADAQCGPNQVCLIACSFCACIDADGDGLCENDPAECGCIGSCVDPIVECVDEGDLDGDGYSECSGDCNERDASQHPGAAELQDGIDNDCNGLVDDATAPGECQVDADCGPGQVCQSIYPPCACLDSDGDGVCENDLSSCAPTNVCVDVNPAPGCYSDADCAAGSTCNANEACLPPPGCGPGHECLTVCYGTCSPAI